MLRNFKTNSLRWQRLLIVVIISTFVIGLSAQFGGGTGTADDPWHISRPEHLNSIRNYLGAAHADKHYIQTENIDLGVAPWNEGQGWVPLGNTAANSFQGHYNGGQYLISNLTINRTAGNQSLFGWIVSATIRNVGLLNVNVIGQDTPAGLVSYVDGESVVERCFVSGTVAGTNNVAGLIGRLQGAASAVYDCYSAANATRVPGGIFEVDRPNSGGLIGIMGNGVVHRCYSIGRIESTYSPNSAAVIGNRAAGELLNIYWNRETANREYAVAQDDAIPGNTTLEMLRRGTFNGFNFDTVWTIEEDFSYPYFQWQREPLSPNIPGPHNLTALSSNQTVDLSWQSPIMNVEPLGYNVYRDNRRINEELVAAREYRDTGLTNWTFYDYYVTAVFEQGESSPTNTIRVSPVSYAGGSGTEEDPFRIETAEQLDRVRFSMNSYFRQIAHLDLGVAPWNEGEGWNSIGSVGDPFTGHYDGDFYRIGNLTMAKDVMDRFLSDHGLFSAINGATLTKMVLHNVDVTAAFNTGMLVGNSSNSLISKCTASGIVFGSTRVGGITAVSRNETVIDQCYTTGTVRARLSEAGGIVGQLTNGSSIIDSYSTAIANGNQRDIGGLVGTNIDGNIIRSYAVGWVYANYVLQDVGGLVGRYGEGEAENSYWNTQSTNQSESAIGEARTTEQMLTAENYENWDFNAIWAIEEGLSYPYHRWQQTFRGHNLPTPINFTVTPDFHQQTNNLSWEAVRAPVRYEIYRDNIYVTSVQHPTMNWVDEDCELLTFYSYHIKSVFEIDEQVFTTPQTKNVTSVLVTPFVGGSGTIEDPYQVGTPDQLNNIRYLLNGNFIQVANIDLDVAPYNEGEGWLPIGTNDIMERFTGTYNGNGYAISNLFINRGTGTYQGLIAYIEKGLLENIHLENVNITANNYFGALVGYQHESRIIGCSVSGSLTSTNATSSFMGGLIGQRRYGDDDTNAIINCYSTASVHGANYKGGLVGDSWTGVVLNSWASGNVTGTRSYSGGLAGYTRNPVINSYATGNVTVDNTYTGGLVGVSTGPIVNCYARGNVTGTTHIGGLAGRTTNTVTNSYSTGRVTGGTTNIGGLIGSTTGQTEASYWDTETSNRPTSQGGEGRLSRQMTYPYDHLTYVDWDFEEIWADDINNINNGYPILHYQFVRLDTPEVEIEIVTIQNADYSRLSWEAVEGALSYKVYASFNPYSEEWGEPVATIGENQYFDPIEDNRTKFYYVVASTDPPEGRR